jgi:chromosome segregation ATPase
LKETVEAKKESEFLRQRMEEQARLHEELLRQHNSLTGEHGSLIEQQKVLLGNNQRLTAEMAALNSDIQRREKENKVITGELNATKQEIAVLQNELSGKKVQNQSLTEEAGRNRNEILLLTTENVTLKNDLGNTTEKLREKSVEHATSLKTAAGQMDRLRTSLMKLENENLEQKRKLDEIYKSLTWKVGSFLIRKPADLFRRKR